MQQVGGSMRSASERFWEKVDTSSECWIWTAAKTNHGYGNFFLATINGKKKYECAHRYAFKEKVGHIPDGLFLDHLCMNRACVNPAHLEPVTNRENLRRGPHVTKTKCIRGHDRTPENTVIKPNGTTSCRVCKNIRQRKSDKNQ